MFVSCVLKLCVSVMGVGKKGWCYGPAWPDGFAVCILGSFFLRRTAFGDVGSAACSFRLVASSVVCRSEATGWCVELRQAGSLHPGGQFRGKGFGVEPRGWVVIGALFPAPDEARTGSAKASPNGRTAARTRLKRFSLDSTASMACSRDAACGLALERCRLQTGRAVGRHGMTARRQCASTATMAHGRCW